MADFFDLPKIKVGDGGYWQWGGAYQLQCAILAVQPCPLHTGPSRSRPFAELLPPRATSSPWCTTRVWILRCLCESIRWQHAGWQFSGFATTHQWSHDHSTTVQQRRFDNTANRADQRSGWHVGSWLATMQKMPSLERRKEEDRQNRRNCATQNLTTLLDWLVSTSAQGRDNLLCIGPSADWDTKSKRTQKYWDVQGHSDARACSPDSNAVDQDSEDTKDKKLVFSSKLPTTWNVRRTQTRSENEVPTKNGEKQDQREILQSRDIRQVHNKRRVEVDCQNRDSLEEDVCSCLACPKTFPRFLRRTNPGHSGRDVICWEDVDVMRISYGCSYEHPQKATYPTTECRTRPNLLMGWRHSNLRRIIVGIIERRCSSCFPTFAGLQGRIKDTSPSFLDQERFHHSTSRNPCADPREPGGVTDRLIQNHAQSK